MIYEYSERLFAVEEPPLSLQSEVAVKMTVPEDATILEVLRVIDQGAKSIAFVRDRNWRIIGVITDGDMRRAILSGASLTTRSVAQVMRRDFVSVTPEMGRAEVLDTMRARRVTEVPVLDAQGWLCGVHTMSEMVTPGVRPNIAVIMAGGKGTRLAPITQSLPKPMIPVAGRPILERLILHLMSCGIRHICISVNYMADVIQDYFGDGSGFGCSIIYLREDVPLGTGGSLSMLPELPKDPIVVLNGDLVTQCDVAAMLDYNNEQGYSATFGLRPYSVAIPFGVAQVAQGRLIDLEEKPTLRMLINAGIYVISPAALELIPRNQEFPITDLFAGLLERKERVGAYIVDGDWTDVGRPEELARARGEQL